jgi:hypothetical protein
LSWSIKFFFLHIYSHFSKWKRWAEGKRNEELRGVKTYENTKNKCVLDSIGAFVPAKTHLGNEIKSSDIMKLEIELIWDLGFWTDWQFIDSGKNESPFPTKKSH